MGTIGIIILAAILNVIMAAVLTEVGSSLANLPSVAL